MKPRPFPKLVKKELIRLFNNVKKTKTCWLWTGYCRPDGYGHMTITRNNETRSLLVHRLMYQELKKTPSQDLVLDHRCQNKLCVYPKHLREVTDRTNILNSPLTLAHLNAIKTHCLRGHPLIGKNLRINTTSGNRECISCGIVSKKRYADRIKMGKTRVVGVNHGGIIA